jgi:hypothetical protein
VFVPGKPFQPRLIFVGKTGAYPIEEPSRGQCYKHFLVRDLKILVLSYSVLSTRLEKFVKDKHSSLL